MAAKTKVRKCHICERRPATTEQGYCHNCQQQLEAEKRRKRQPTPLKYLTYKGITVAFQRDGGDILKPQLVRRDPDKLPKSKLINLDTYCSGFTREQVKKLKRLCLSFAK
jgi:predicted nucleic acid-binding Zn ribbon protein